MQGGSAQQTIPENYSIPRAGAASARARKQKGLQAPMLFRVSEVAAAIALVLMLLAAKHVPALSFLPLSQMTGVVCFSFAIFLSLRIYKAELQRLRAGD